MDDALQFTGMSSLQIDGPAALQDTSMLHSLGGTLI